MDCEGISFAHRNSWSLSTLNVGGIDLSDFNFSTMFSSVLSSLILTNAKITDEVLESILRANLQLKRFVLIRCKDYTFPGVSCVLEKYPCLKSLALDGAKFLTNEFINRLRPSISKLEHLSLNFCPRLSDSTFMTLMKTCGSVSILEMAGTNIGTRDEQGLGSPSWRKNHQLIKPNVSLCPKLSNNGLKRLLSRCPSLQWLDSPNCFHEEELGIADVLEICSGILHLNIQSCGLVKFSNKQKEPMIVELDQFVAGCSGIDNEVLEMVGRRCLGLSLLDMNSCEDVTKEGVKAVAAACTRLRYLNLSWCDRVNAEILDWVVSTCGSLRHLASPSDSHPENEQIREFLRHGCLVDLCSDELNYTQDQVRRTAVKYNHETYLATMYKQLRKMPLDLEVIV